MTTIAEFQRDFPHAFAAWAERVELPKGAAGREDYVPNWKQIAARFKFVAVDRDGGVYAFTHRPYIDTHEYWESGEGEALHLKDVSINPPNVDLWRTMIYERPTPEVNNE